MKLRKIAALLLTMVTIFCFATACKKGGDNSNGNSGTVNDEQTVMLSTTNVILSVNETAKVVATVSESRKGSLVFFSVRDENIATVTNEGVVTGVGVGNTILYAQCGEYTALCSITVNAYAAPSDLNIVLTKTSYALNVGDRFVLPFDVCFGKEKLKEYDVDFVVEDESIATIGDGLIAAIKVGKTDALITAKITVEDKEYTARRIITINVY